MLGPHVKLNKGATFNFERLLMPLDFIHILCKLRTIPIRLIVTIALNLEVQGFNAVGTY